LISCRSNNKNAKHNVATKWQQSTREVERVDGIIILTTTLLIHLFLIIFIINMNKIMQVDNLLIFGS